MPVIPIQSGLLQYYLLSYDSSGTERTDDPGGPLAERVLEAVRKDAVTEVFLMCHGWKGDLPAAKQQYDDWLGAALRCTADLEALRARPGGFRPLVIGLHWPSLPFGDEEFESEGATYSPGAGPRSDEELIERYTVRLADSLSDRDTARAALATIFAATQRADEPPKLPDDVRDAYLALNRATGLATAGLGAAPGDDREEFDPERTYEEADELSAVSFGAHRWFHDKILDGVRQLSFWRMKDRARQVGEAGIHDLVRSLQEARPEIRMHLMGHSFGCIVVSAAVAGRESGPPRPVQSLTLVQGALSLWSYCDDIPYVPHGPSKAATPGYFRRVVEKGVSGPIITTRSRFDTAVGNWYRKGARLAGQVAFGATDYPPFGALGSFGARGTGLDLAPDRLLQPAGFDYEFGSGRIYNFDASAVIKTGDGASGAHNDISHEEVAHLVWSAARADDSASKPARAPSAARATSSPASGVSGAAEGAFAELLRAARKLAAEQCVRVQISVDIEPPEE
jgi:hypothetical protein